MTHKSSGLVGIYLFLSFLMYYNISRLANLSQAALTTANAIPNLALGVHIAVAPQLQQIVFGGLSACWQSNRPSGNQSWQPPWWSSLLALSRAWMLDTQGRLCNPSSGPCLAGLTAMAAGFLYLYYLSEDKRLSR